MKKLVVTILIVGLGVMGWRWHARPAAVDGDSLVADRLWIDHLPRNERDTIHVFAVLTEEQIGLFQSVSAWQGAYELFKFERSGDKLRAVFPQTGSKETFAVRARRCDEGSMDFCLELSGGNHGVKRYYSMKGWEIENTAAERRLLETVTH